MKMAVIGGGTRFSANIAHGLDIVLPDNPRGAYEIALYDLDADRVRQMQTYCQAVADRRGLPVRFSLPAGRDEALAGASHVLVSVGLHHANQASHDAIEKYGYPTHSVHDGPTSILTALEAAPVMLDIARAMKRICPEALMVNLVNPTDVLADLAQRAVGIRAVGICVEIPLWVACLAWHLGVDFDEMHAVYGGVNHEGWIKQLRVGGPDGEPVTPQQILAMANDPEVHILNLQVLKIYELTGMLRSSGSHCWLFSFDELPGEKQFWPGRYHDHKSKADALAEKALATGKPLSAEQVLQGHPISDAPLNFMQMGIRLAQWMRAIETSRPARLALQLPNANAQIPNWPRELFVEIPCMATGLELFGEPVGEMPDVPCGLTKLAGIQRKLTADFIMDGTPGAARAALSAMPHLTTVQKQLAFADELVSRREAILDS